MARMPRSRVRLSWTGIVSFTRRLRANAATARSLNDELVAEHGITIEQYEVLGRIARSPDMRVRQADLDDPPLVTAPNVERVLRDLEQDQLVDRGAEGDARVVALTDDGRAKLLAVRSNRAAQLDELLGPTDLPRH